MDSNHSKDADDASARWSVQLKRLSMLCEAQSIVASVLSQGRHREQTRCVYRLPMSPSHRLGSAIETSGLLPAAEPAPMSGVRRRARSSNPLNIHPIGGNS